MSKTRAMTRDLMRRGRLRHLILDDRRGHDAGRQDRGEGGAIIEWPFLELRPVGREREQVIELQLPDDIARSVTGLAKVQQLLEADEAAGGVRPSPGSPSGVELAGFVEPDLVGLHTQR